jgi:DNA-binding response OmpR family regulator
MNKTKILIVDDDRILRTLLHHKLSALGSSVQLTANGIEALSAVATDRPDLIILDGMMPGMDGDETLKRLKANEETRTIPVIMLTARRGDTDAFNALTLGAADYIAKPFNPDELVLRIRRFVETANPQDVAPPERRSA